MIQRIFRHNLKSENMSTLQSITKNYKPFYYFNTESRLNLLDKSKFIKINNKTYYKIK